MIYLDGHVCNESEDEHNEVPECTLFNDAPSIDEFEEDESDDISCDVILCTEDDGLYLKSNTDDENETLAIITKEHRVSG